MRSTSRLSPGRIGRCEATPGPPPRQTAQSLQQAVDNRDPDRLIALFDEPAMLIGTGGDGRRRDGLVAYLTAGATQSASLRWEWADVVPFYDASDALGFGALGFGAFGEIVMTQGGTEQSGSVQSGSE